jgi:hypothetical protein
MEHFCSICQTNIKKNQIKRLACNHVFCKNCLNQWRNNNNNSCPNCRNTIQKPHHYNLRSRQQRPRRQLRFSRRALPLTDIFLNFYLEINEQNRQTRSNSQYLRNLLITQEIKSKLKELTILNNNRRSYIQEKVQIINHIVLLLKQNNWIYNNYEHNKLIIQNRFKEIRNHESDYIKQKVDEWYYELFQIQLSE